MTKFISVFMLLFLLSVITMLGFSLRQTSQMLTRANGDVVVLSQERDKAILANIANVKRLDRCVKQTDASGIDLNGNLIYDRAYEKAREAKMAVKP